MRLTLSLKLPPDVVSIANSLPPFWKTDLICGPSSASFGLASASCWMTWSRSADERSMTRSRSGTAIANLSLSSEKALKPSGATICGAPDALDDRVLLDDFELLDREELDDETELLLFVADAFFLLPSSLVAKKTIAAMIATAATTMAMIGPVPRPEREGGVGAGPGVGVGVGVGMGPAFGNGWVGGASGGCACACSGGYHLPSDACHQPGPCDCSLTGPTSPPSCS